MPSVNTLTIAGQPRGICPTHGEVDGNFYACVTTDPVYRTPNLCPKCYIDWIASHVQAVTPVEAPDAK